GVLRQQAIAGMDGFAVRDGGGRDDAWDIEIARPRLGGTDADGLVSQANGQGVRVGLGVGDDGANAHLPAGAEDAERDLAPVGDEDLVEHGPARRYLRGSSRNRGWPNWTGWALSTRTLTMRPPSFASISFMSFMASMTQRVCPSLMVSPSLTKGGASGLGDRSKVPTMGASIAIVPAAASAATAGEG